MRIGASESALGALAEQKRLDVISNNIANSNTVGFKKDECYFSDVLNLASYTVMDQGPIRETGQTLDLAISGNGFFKVKTDQGTLYTRAGNLTLTRNGPPFAVCRAAKSYTRVRLWRIRRTCW